MLRLNINQLGNFIMRKIKYNFTCKAVTIFFLLFSSLYTAKAQENTDNLKLLEPQKISPPSSVLYLNIGSLGTYTSATLNYEHLLWKPTKGVFKSYYANFDVGVFAVIDLISSVNEGLTSTVGIVGLTGKRNGHFEVGMGVSTLFDSQGEVYPVPDVTLGYRYQRESGFMFRTGLGFIQGLYLSFGTSF
jgi:hypothetical protein